MFGQAVAHIQEQEFPIVARFRVSQAIECTVMRGGDFHTNAIALQVHAIIIRCGQLFILIRVVPFFVGIKSRLRRQQHLTIARPSDARHMQLRKTTDGLMLFVAALPALWGLRRGVHRPMWPLRSNHAVAVATHPHEHIHPVNGFLYHLLDRKHRLCQCPAYGYTCQNEQPKYPFLHMLCRIIDVITSANIHIICHIFLQNL